MTKRCVALLGRPDRPTDAVEDYCRYLSQALEKHGFSLELLRVPWTEQGWSQALGEVRKKAEEHRGSWFLVQYTALAWSRRGFPLRVPKLIQSLKDCGARCAVVFHDAIPYGGERTIDRLRRVLQVHVMRQALRLADLAIFPVLPEKVPWIPKDSRNIVFIPVGANLPEPQRAWSMEKKGDDTPTVCAFSVAPGPAGSEEVDRIGQALGHAAKNLGKLRLVVAGRNSAEAGRELQQRLADAGIEIIAHGVLPAAEIVRVLGACDVMLFPRGGISSRRSSALAGIACGLPVIASEGPETAAPLTEAGVVLLPAGAKDEFGPALVRVLTDNAFRETLAQQSRLAQERFFSWGAISAEYLKFLRESETAPTESPNSQEARGPGK